MKITMTPTETITTVDGAPCRIWEGVTDRGIKCAVFVLRLAVHKDEDTFAFDVELRETAAPREFDEIAPILESQRDKP